MADGTKRRRLAVGMMHETFMVRTPAVKRAFPSSRCLPWWRRYNLQNTRTRHSKFDCLSDFDPRMERMDCQPCPRQASILVQERQTGDDGRETSGDGQAVPGYYR